MGTKKAEGWQPIETLTEEHSSVLLTCVCKHGDRYVIIGFKYGDLYLNDSECVIDEKILGWMPLPEPMK